MKRGLLLLLAVFALINVKAQEITIDENAIVLTKVIENTDMSVSTMHDLVLAFFGDLYKNKDKENHLILNNEDRISVKGEWVQAYVYDNYLPSINFHLIYHCDVEPKVDVFFKENRMRIKVSCDKAKYYQRGDRVELYDFYLGTCCAAKGEACTDKPAMKKPTYDACIVLMNKMANDIEKYILKNKNDNDW